MDIKYIPVKAASFNRFGQDIEDGYQINGQFFSNEKILEDDYDVDTLDDLYLKESYIRLRDNVILRETEKFTPNQITRYDGPTGPPPPSGYEREYRGTIRGWELGEHFIEKGDILNELYIPQNMEDNEEFMNEFTKLREILLSENMPLIKG